MDPATYQNPLNKTVLEGAVRVLKRLAVDAGDEQLAKLVQQIEQHYLGHKDKENGT